MQGVLDDRSTLLKLEACHPLCHKPLSKLMVNQLSDAHPSIPDLIEESLVTSTKTRLFLDKAYSLQWRHNERDGVSNHQPHDCLLNCYSGTDERKHQRSASLAFVRGIQRWPVNSPHKGPITRKMFPLDDVIMMFAMTAFFCLLYGVMWEWSRPMWPADSLRKGSVIRVFPCGDAILISLNMKRRVCAPMLPCQYHLAISHVNLY